MEMSLRLTNLLMVTRPRLAAILLTLAKNLRSTLYHLIGKQVTPRRQVGIHGRCINPRCQKYRLAGLLRTDELWYGFLSERAVRCRRIIILELRIARMEHKYLLLGVR